VAIEKFLKPAIGDTSLSRLARLGSRPFEQLDAERRVCRRRCKGRTFRFPRPRPGRPVPASFDAVLADSGIRSAFIR
jgi:hypothetical protein